MKTLFISLILAIFSLASAKAQDGAQDYYRAYNICSPAAHFLTRQACNYGVIFEKYYTNCMSHKGYGGESDVGGDNYYEGYMRAYNKCSNVAEQGAENSCNYGQSYKKHYITCMSQHNFNEHGERISSNGENNLDQNAKDGFQFNF